LGKTLLFFSKKKNIHVAQQWIAKEELHQMILPSNKHSVTKLYQLSLECKPYKKCLENYQLLQYHKSADFYTRISIQ
jgi:hypothetical protein